MTAVDLNDLDKVIKTTKIPVEVCLANLTYHVKANRPSLNHYDSFYPSISLKEKVYCKYVIFDSTIIVQFVQSMHLDIDFI